jgi:hypothetical protein
MRNIDTNCLKETAPDDKCLDVAHPLIDFRAKIASLLDLPAADCFWLIIDFYSEMTLRQAQCGANVSFSGVLASLDSIVFRVSTGDLEKNLALLEPSVSYVQEIITYPPKLHPPSEDLVF